MLLKNLFWYFKGALSDQFCDEVIKYGNSKVDEKGRVGGTATKKLNKDQKKFLKKTRDSNVAWLSDRWIFDEILPYINKANQNAEWNFDIDFCEAIQFTKYKKNQFYEWHCDPMPEPYNSPDKPNIHGKIRKISATIQLSDPKDYSGGEFQIQPRNQANPAKPIITVKEAKPRGSVLVFPSELWHRVKPITKGTRYSLVVWNLGYPFK